MSLEPLDLLHGGTERIIATYLLETAGGPALVDCGPSSCIDTLKRGTPLDAVTLRIEWRSRFGCACAPTAIELEPLVGCCPTCGAMESYADTTAFDIRFLQPDIEAA